MEEVPKTTKATPQVEPQRLERETSRNSAIPTVLLEYSKLEHDHFRLQGDLEAEKTRHVTTQISIKDSRETGPRPSDENLLRQENMRHADTKKQLEAMKVEVQRLHDEALENKEELEEFKADMDQMKDQLGTLKEQLAKKDTEMTKLKAGHKNEHSELVRNLSDKHKEVDKLVGEREGQAKEIENLKSAVESIRGILRGL